MGVSPTKLYDGGSYLRRHRIYQASLVYHGGGVKKPRYEYQDMNVWMMCGQHFEKNLEITRSKLKLPNVFTKRQMFVAVAICWLWDIQGEHAHFTYDTILDLIPHIRIDGDSINNVSYETIAKVIYMFHDSGASKYIPGYQGVKSQMILHDLTDLLRLPARPTKYEYNLPNLAVTTPVPSTPTPFPSLGTQSSGFLKAGYEHLLQHLYNLRIQPNGKVPSAWRTRVTRTFNQALREQGLAGVYEWDAPHPKYKYPLRTWRVSYKPDDDWKIQVAVYKTRDRLLGWLDANPQ